MESKMTTIKSYEAPLYRLILQSKRLIKYNASSVQYKHIKSHSSKKKLLRRLSGVRTSHIYLLEGALTLVCSKKPLWCQTKCQQIQIKKESLLSKELQHNSNNDNENMWAKLQTCLSKTWKMRHAVRNKIRSILRTLHMKFVYIIRLDAYLSLNSRIILNNVLEWCKPWAVSASKIHLISSFLPLGSKKLLLYIPSTKSSKGKRKRN